MKILKFRVVLFHMAQLIVFSIFYKMKLLLRVKRSILPKAVFN